MIVCRALIALAVLFSLSVESANAQVPSDDSGYGGSESTYYITTPTRRRTQRRNRQRAQERREQIERQQREREQREREQREQEQARAEDEGSQEPRVVSIDDLEVGSLRPDGAHSSAHPQDDGTIAIITDNSHPRHQEAVEEHLRAQAEYMEHVNEVLESAGEEQLAPEQVALIETSDGVTTGRQEEQVDGETLRDLIDSGELTRAQLEEIERQLREQFATLHENDLIHGDPNPGNTMVDVAEDGTITVSLIDFEPPSDAFGVSDDQELLDRLINTHMWHQWEQSQQSEEEPGLDDLVDLYGPFADDDFLYGYEEPEYCSPAEYAGFC